MLPKEKGPGRFYELFKVHKAYEPGTLPPERPIVSASGSLTENLSLYVDHHLKGFVPKIETYLKDTGAFLRHIEEINENQDMLDGSVFPVSLDVSALYLNIPSEDGITAVKKVLSSLGTKIHTKFIIDLLRIVLECNIFEYDEELYLQKHGTAMGTRVAPSFANIFMATIDREILKISEILQKSGSGYLTALKRFIDDLFFLWHGTEAQLKQFVTKLNNIHPCIRFTTSYNIMEKSTTFLDTKVQIKNGKICTDLYRKSTDKVQYLLPSSAHPSHTTRNIPFSLALRIRKICSEPENVENRMNELRCMLKSRSYSHRIIENAIERAMEKPRKELLQNVEKEQSDRITFVLNFSPHLPSVSNILQKHYRTLTRNPRMKKLYPEPPMVAFKQESNLKKILCRAKVPREKHKTSMRLQSQVGLKKCLQPRCKVCTLVDDSAVIRSTSDTTSTFTVRGSYTCDSSSVIYKINCSKCNVSYVGQTGRTLRKRIQEHLDYVRLNREATGCHFNLPGHDLSHLHVQVLEQVSPPTRILRETREQLWIQRLDTKVPRGLNRRD